MRPSVTPEYAGWSSEPWPSTNSTSPPRRTPSSTSCSAAPAMKSATTASTEIPQPAIAIPVWPVGMNSLRTPRAFASRSSSSATVIFPIAQSDPTMRIDVAPCVRFSPVGTLRPERRLAEVAQLDAALSRECSQLVVFRQELVQAVLDVEAGVDALLEEGTPGRREAAALRRDADERGRRRVPQRVVDGADERESFVLRLVALASRARRRRPAARSGSPRARSCRNAGRPNAPPRGRAAYAGETPSPGRSEGS